MKAKLWLMLLPACATMLAACASTTFGALVTLFADTHDVHTFTRRRSPSTSMIFAVCRLGSQRRRLLLLAWLTLFPLPGCLPHT